MVPAWELRAAFARRLSDMYGSEVPAYTTLLEVAGEVNEDVMRADPHAERLGSIDRVTAERHGAIRVGTPAEMRQVGQIFAALGMHPVGFYDLREPASSAIPVVSTAFRPLDATELARNPFRVFTSMLTVDDRRFFNVDLQERLEAFLAARQLFPPELLDLAHHAERDGELSAQYAERFLLLAVAAFELSPEPVDRAWYAELQRTSDVAADIGGVTSTHINHLTPRVLDIDDLYLRMQTRGIAMIDEIQGPPRWHGPDVLLRQTSFRALAEPRTFREPDGSVTTGSLRVRFGEVEARGIALTRKGRALYDELMEQTNLQLRENPDVSRQSIAAEIWDSRFPHDERMLAAEQLAFFSYEPTSTPPAAHSPSDLVGLLDAGWITAQPIVYEDFLPRSAAGIFASNLTDQGEHDATQTGTHHDEAWLSQAMERPVHDPFDVYGLQQEESLQRALHALGLVSPR